MWRLVLRVASVLAIIHALLTFVAAYAIFRRVSPDSLGFAQHGFTFILIAISTW